MPYLLSEKVLARIRLKEPAVPLTSPRVSEPEYVKPPVDRRPRNPLDVALAGRFELEGNNVEDCARA